MATINIEAFWSRVNAFYASWNRAGPYWGGETAVDALMIPCGKSADEDENPYSRWQAVMLYLFGYESQNTIIVFTKTKMHILLSSKKMKTFSPLESKTEEIKLQFHVLQKREDPTEHFDALINAMKSSGEGKRVGYIKKQPVEGKLATKFVERVDLEKVDVSVGWALVTCRMDRFATEKATIAGSLTTAVHKKYLQSQIEDIVDKERKITHAALADQLDEIISNFDEKKKEIGIKQGDIEGIDVESCYSTIIMSGGDYDLRPSAQSNNMDMDYGTIVVAAGMRYQSFCTNAVRTYFINPSETQKEVYALLTAVWQECMTQLRPGKPMNEIYNRALALVKRKKPELASKFTKSCGFGIGLEFRNSSMILNTKNNRTIRKGMMFNLSIGFTQLHVEGKHSQVASDTKTRSVFAVGLADTVIVTDAEPKVLTNIKRAFESVSYEIGDSDDESEDDQVMADLDTRIKLRERDEVSVDTKRAEHQSVLAERKREESLAQLAKEKQRSRFNKDKKELERFVAYADAASLPTGLPEGKLYVDSVNEAILCPIGLNLIPFHVRMIKSISKNEEGKYTVLRVGFHVPEGVSKNKIPSFVDHKQHFIRELLYRSTSTSLTNVFFDIKELRKLYADRQRDQAERKSLVKQPDLQVDRNVGAAAKLRDVSFRPSIGRNKKAGGTLSAHVNGLRYESTDRVRVDVIYKNIRSCYFQPSDSKVPNTVLHFDLKHPIMIGKKKPKKTHWVQFFVEVTEGAHDVDAGRYRDDDGLAEAQAERENRARWNKRFRDFGKKLQQHVKKHGGDLEFDLPNRKLGFNGNPHRQQVVMYPSNHALIALDDEPPLVILLKDIEICSLERVRFSLRNFDMTIVFKDLKKTPLRIDTIPIKQIEAIKSWLDSSNIIYKESATNLSWKNIMKHINEDVPGFYKDGAWKFLDPESSDDEAGEPQSDESAFEPDDEDDDEYESESSEEIEEDESEWDSGSGEDWDELESKAKASDRAKRGADDGDDDAAYGRAKKKRRR